jgi:F420-dependent oxidoreductase-like protein
MSPPDSSMPPRRAGRIGLVVKSTRTNELIATIVAAERAGVPQVWITQPVAAPESMCVLAAAAMRTSEIGLGTAVVPVPGRHPVMLAQQALLLHDLAPGRFRLGIGPSHREIVEGNLGLPLIAPLSHLREYLDILRRLLWQGRAEHHGRFFRVDAQLPRPAPVPLLISALRVKSFGAAGEVADGALSWLCPPSYLRTVAAPAVRAAAAANGRLPPPVVAHVPVVLADSRAAILAAARPLLAAYARRPFYAGMFADAGFPLDAPDAVSDELIDELIVGGDEAQVGARLAELLGSGLDELMIMGVPSPEAGSNPSRLIRLVADLARTREPA